MYKNVLPILILHMHVHTQITHVRTYITISYMSYTYCGQGMSITSSACSITAPSYIAKHTYCN